MTAVSPSYGNGRGLRLEKVIGVSAWSSNSVDVGGEVAYPAGCTVVLYDEKAGKQRTYMRMAKPVACLRYSPDGSFLAVGERGHNPAITVWDTKTHERIAELKGHKIGITGLRFSPDSSLLASIGFEHDDQLIVWDWRKEEDENIVARTQLTAKTHGLDFTPDGSHVVVAGEKYVSFFELQGNSTLVEHKAGITEDYAQATFLDVLCGRGALEGSTFLGTSCGSLICLGSNRLMDKWVYLEAGKVSSLSVEKQGMLACACEKGICRVFMADSFEFVCSLPKPRRVDMSVNDQAIQEEDGEDEEEGAMYADAVSVRWCEGEEKHLAVTYQDKSIYVWDMSDTDSIKCHGSLLSHSHGIASVVSMPTSKRAKSFGIPESLLVTCGEDMVLRFWKIGGSKKKMQTWKQAWVNGMSQELVREIFLGSGKEGTTCKSLAVSRDGTLVAVGDRNGRVVIYDLASDSIVLDDPIAHQGEVMSLHFSPRVTSPNRSARLLLASAGRDRLIHIFAWGAENDAWNKAKTLKDHSAVVTSVSFSMDGKKLLSAGGDKTIVISNVDIQADDVKISRDKSVSVPYGTVHDIDVDASNKYFCTVGQDKKINIWSLSNGKAIRSYKPEGDVAELNTVQLDPAGMFCAVGSNDKSIRLFDFYSGECIGKSAGHSEALAGLAYTSDCKRLVSVAWDGCMFVWRLAPEITAAIKERLKEIELQSTMTSLYPNGQDDQQQENSRVENGKRKEAWEDGKPITSSSSSSLHSLSDGEADGSVTSSSRNQDNEPSSNGNNNQALFQTDELPAWAKKRVGNSETEELDDDEDNEEDEDDGEIEDSQDTELPLHLEDLTSSRASPTSSSSSSVLTAPRSPLPAFGESKSLSQERNALKLQEKRKDTDSAVRRMRDQLKSLGILEATAKKVNLAAVPIQEEEEAEGGETQTKNAVHTEDGREKEDDDDEDDEDLVPGLVSPFVGTGAVKAESVSRSLGGNPSKLGVPIAEKNAAKERAELSPLKTLELPSESRDGPGVDMGPLSKYSAAATPLRTAEDARMACEVALGTLKSALSMTADIFRKVEVLEGNLGQSIESVRDSDKDDFTRGVLETSRSHVQSIMGEFQSQLQDIVEHQIGPLTHRRDGHSDLNRSMFLSTSLASASNAPENKDMQAILSKLTTISNFMEKMSSNINE